MSALTPLQQIQLRHNYTLDANEIYAVELEFGGYGFTAEELTAAEVHELLDTLTATATQALKRKTPTLPYAQLSDVYTIVDQDDWELCESGLDIENQKCLDCGINTCTELHEYYMVLNSVWTSAVPEHTGMICIGCLETRLGRQLTRSDFIDAPINADGDWWRSQRLQARLDSPGRLTPTDW